MLAFILDHLNGYHRHVACTNGFEPINDIFANLNLGL